MPELAEVEFFRRRWLAGLGEPVLSVECHRQARVFRGSAVSDLAASLTRASLVSVQAHGKNLLATFSGGQWLGLHLGMTGELRVEPEGFVSSRHDHLVIHQASRSLVFADSRMFGRVRFDHSPSGPPDWWQNLPPAVLGPDFTATWVRDQLARRAGSPIKAALLDQSLFPGIGNWMADEILWRLRRHPSTPVADLDTASLRSLRQQVRWVASRALATIGVDWQNPPRSWLYLHRWSADSRCPRPACGTPLRREKTAGRTTCWCPACQSIPLSVPPSPLQR
ncbi:MAG: Fpg/Nei family DNA glycosylase, partial [Verrucomicrobiales bacterium]